MLLGAALEVTGLLSSGLLGLLGTELLAAAVTGQTVVEIAIVLVMTAELPAETEAGQLVTVGPHEVIVSIVVL